MLGIKWRCIDLYLLASSSYDTNSPLFDMIETNRPKIMDCFGGSRHTTPHATACNLKPVHFFSESISTLSKCSTYLLYFISDNLYQTINTCLVCTSIVLLSMSPIMSHYDFLLCTNRLINTGLRCTFGEPSRLLSPSQICQPTPSLPIHAHERTHTHTLTSHRLDQVLLHIFSSVQAWLPGVVSAKVSPRSVRLPWL